MTKEVNTARRWRAVSRATAAAGIASFVLGPFASQAFIQVGGVEPAFGASAAEIHAFFQGRDPVLFPIGSYLALISFAAFSWFLAGLWTLLKAAEGDPPWRSTAALVSGVVFVAIVFIGGWELAVFRAREGIDPQLARFAFDLGNLGFTSSWLALGSFSIAAGWAVVSSRALPGWLGWWAVVAGAGLVVARAIWTTSFWLLPFLLFWLWVIVLSVFLLRRSPAPLANGEVPDAVKRLA